MVSNQSTVHKARVEFEGDNATTLLQGTLNQLDFGEDVTRISIEVEAESAITLTQPEEEPPEEASVESAEPEETEAEEAETLTVDEETPQARFYAGSSTWAVIQTLYDRREEGFFEIGEVQQFTPNKEGVRDNEVSNILYTLADRGHLEKKPHPEDGRKNVYKITGKGVDAVEETMAARGES